MTVLLITGTRDLNDPRKVWQVLHRWTAQGPGILIHGDARGVDAAADAIARRCGWTVVRIGADWKAHGRSAGARRNAVLVKLAARYREFGHDVRCLAFPGPNSRGTHDCARKAHRAGIPVERIDE